MKKVNFLRNVFVCLTFFLMAAVFSIAQQRYEVVRKSGNRITINAGVRAGVRVDFSGRTYRELQVGGQNIQVDTGRFRVDSVTENESEAVIESESPTDPVEIGQKVNFDQALVPPPQRGTLNIRSDPSGASVDIDGARRGTTPFSITLEPGAYRVRLSRSGYQDESDTVTVSSNRETRRNYSLTLIPPPSFTVSIRTTPSDADVFVDDVRRGVTPLTFDVTNRNILVRIEKENFRTFEESLTLNRTGNTFDFPLEKIKFKLSIETVPPEAMVFLDGREMGTSPQTIVVDKGKHKLSLKKEGYKETEEEIEISDDMYKLIELPEFQKGTLIISFYPFAEVEIDGKSYGEIPPVLQVELYEGKHTVRFFSTRLNNEKTIEVVIEAGKTEKVHEKFKTL
ncbi:MAG: PEGA domain-containing protein [Candidatus Aminicenantes bacterium]|nr:PEGA domain-containing protein [Candidatus Aminicenantes bacterium]